MVAHINKKYQPVHIIMACTFTVAKNMEDDVIKLYVIEQTFSRPDGKAMLD